MLKCSAALFAILLLAPPGLAQQPSSRQVLEGSGASISFAPGQKHLARATLAIYPAVLRHLEENLGIPFTQTAYIYLCRSEAEFHDVTGGHPEKWTAALAFPTDRLIVIDASKLQPVGSHSIHTTLTHEMVHLILGRIQQKAVKIPAWFNEGLATWASRPLSPFPQEKLVLAAKAATLPHYRSLDNSFLASEADADLAYAASYAFVSYLEDEFGIGTLRTLLAAMNQGADIQSAVTRATSDGLDELWAKWSSGLSRSGGLVAMLKLLFIRRRGLGTFAFLALLVLLAYARYLFVKRRKLKKWEEEEQLGYW